MSAVQARDARREPADRPDAAAVRRGAAIADVGNQSLSRHLQRDGARSPPAGLLTQAARQRSLSGASSLGSAAAAGAGNQRLLALQRQGRLRAKLEVGGATDPAEAEADRMADAALAGRAPCACGGVCDKCRAGGVLRRKPVGGQGAPAARSTPEPFADAGRPLDGGQLTFFEQRFGADLSSVRIHDGEAAASAARRLGARAFAVEGHIGFGADQYDPGSDDGRRLLAHELAHTVQDDPTTLRRQNDPNATAGHQAGGQPADQGGQNQPGAPAATRAGPLRADHPTGYNPCTVDVPSLSNYALMAELHETAAYLGARKRGVDAYYDYANLMRRLVAERRQRIAMGHLWMSGEAADFPGTLYQIAPQANGTLVVSLANADAVSGAPAPATGGALMRPEQFRAFLASNGIPEMSVEDFYARVGREKGGEALTILPQAPPANAGQQGQDDYSGLFFNQPGVMPWGDAVAPTLGPSGALVSPFDIFARPNLVRNVYSPNVNMGNPRSLSAAELQWRGGLPEYASGYGTYADILSQRDLNYVRRNFEVFDFADRGGTGDFTSVTHSAAGDPDWYGKKFSRMTGAEEPGKFTTSLGRLNTEFSKSLTPLDVNTRNYLEVPDDHVPMVRTEVDRIVMNEAERVAPMLDALLRSRAASPGGAFSAGGAAYANWNDVQAARTSGALSAGDYQNLLSQLSPLAQQRVRGMGQTLPQVMEMQRIRVATQGLSPFEFGTIAPPELLEVRRLMATGMAEPEARATVARSSAWQGAKFGGAISAAFDVAECAASGFDARTCRMMAEALPVQTGGAALGGYAQAQWNARMLSPLLADATSGTATTLTTGSLASGVLRRVGGGGAIGGPIAALTTMGVMGVQELSGDADYSRIDYGAKGSRALVVGGIAGMAAELGPLGFSAYCAAAGTPEAPGVGTAIGFVVGLGAYFVIDAVAGDAIEQKARDAMGEQGCTS